MALSQSSALSFKSIIQSYPTNHHSHQSHQPTISLLPPTNSHRRPKPISAVHAAEPAKNVTKAPSPPSVPKWSLESWKSKKALQLPEYPNKASLAAVLKTLEDFPPIVFAGEARHLEERLADAAVGNPSADECCFDVRWTDADYQGKTLNCDLF